MFVFHWTGNLIFDKFCFYNVKIYSNWFFIIFLLMCGNVHDFCRIKNYLSKFIKINTNNESIIAFLFKFFFLLIFIY